MKILTSTYFKDFARYFLYLENEFKKYSKDVDFFNISIYPCAHNYWIKNKKHSILLPQEVLKIKNINFNKILKENVYKEIDLDKIIDFNYKSQLMYNLNQKIALKKQAIRYIKYFDNLFKNQIFDYYISSGDSRMLIEISNLLAKRYNIKIFYFEQGPFGTTMIDDKGVNCNISFLDRIELNSNIDINKLNTFIHDYKYNKKEKYFKYEKRSLIDKFYDLKTFNWMYPCKYFNKLVPSDTQIGSSTFSNLLPILKNKVIKQKVDINKETLPSNFITFIMQVPVDAQLINNSPLYNDFFLMLKDIYEALPKGYNLVIREHPNYIGKYTKNIYQYINTRNNIYLLNNVSLHETLKNSKLIILNNSTVGIEALTYFKTVLTLGKAYYNREHITYNLDERENLSKLIQKALINPIDKKNINIFLSNFIFDYLINGHFQDNKLQNSEKIINKILEKN